MIDMVEIEKMIDSRKEEILRELEDAGWDTLYHKNNKLVSGKAIPLEHAIKVFNRLFDEVLKDE